MGNTHIASIPFWVRDSLWRSGHKIEDLLDLSKVSKFLSTREVAILVTLQSPEYQKIIFGTSLGDRAMDFISHWKNSSHASLHPAADKIVEYMRLNELGDEIRVRLFDCYECPTSNQEHVVTEVKGIGLAATIMPNTYMGDKHASNSAALTREMCKRLYKYEGMGGLMATPLGAHYIETLSR